MFKNIMQDYKQKFFDDLIDLITSYKDLVETDKAKFLVKVNNIKFDDSWCISIQQEKVDNQTISKEDVILGLIKCRNTLFDLKKQSFVTYRLCFNNDGLVDLYCWKY